MAIGMKNINVGKWLFVVVAVLIVALILVNLAGVIEYGDFECDALVVGKNIVGRMGVLIYRVTVKVEGIETMQSVEQDVYNAISKGDTVKVRFKKTYFGNEPRVKELTP
ncbi:MAG TPA: hypothetical protein PKV16_04805 [Caldisericia bacterium]|mgnify:CR=1 FL=1|nr:hypothetical protein [Caldisericia bacterium]HPF48631.1 hypothetical protein [Caldisericia bacterium]HPI83709.1 hypothetical protein [Caldisericia bacterium]HPQ93086.1 hypothetical protein [Caldisericia bacterium]HRV75081.1 hypothetical protein [Caldisericia bacterium]